jgi:UDP-N-acetylmuramate dehydrogenase
MRKLKNVSLKNYSSFHCGGMAENLIECESNEELRQAVRENLHSKITVLGYGTNVLISDKGLSGNTIITKGGKFSFDDCLLVTEAGAWWDDIVQASIEHELWGIELMSGIPSSIGGAVVGNIAAYGQQIADTLEWVEVIATDSQNLLRIPSSELSFSYRHCSLSNQPNLVLLKAAFKLSNTPTKSLEYGSALRIADELNLDPNSLPNRRTIIVEARKRAGSLYNPAKNENSYTAGSFFKNPIVTIDVARKIIAYDETGKSAEMLLKQNQIHGGNDHRVSAAHVLLAAGFKRGQSWGNVRLHPEHILKIENFGGASSQEIYDVAREIIDTVSSKLNIKLKPEVKFLGDFSG